MQNECSHHLDICLIFFGIIFAVSQSTEISIESNYLLSIVPELDRVLGKSELSEFNESDTANPNTGTARISGVPVYSNYPDTGTIRILKLP